MQRKNETHGAKGGEEIPLVHRRGFADDSEQVQIAPKGEKLRARAAEAEKAPAGSRDRQFGTGRVPAC